MRSRGRFFGALRAARARRRWSREDYVRFQGERLRALVRHARDRVPFFRKKYGAAGLDPDSVRGVEDIGRIPVLSRDEIIGLPAEEVVAEGVDHEWLRVSMTSGSTGEPLVIRRLGSEGRHMGAQRLEVLKKLGMRRRDKMAVVAFRPQGGPRQRPLLRLLNLLGLHRHQTVHTAGGFDRIAKELVEGRPDVILGLTAVLCRLAKTPHAEELGKIGVRFIFPGGQKLMPPMRRTMEDLFRARVYDGYATYEFGVVAWECPETGELHVCDGSLILEVLRDGRPVEPGEQGEVVVTSLHAFVSPLIRYRLGDLAVRGKETCACGAPLSTIREIVGREADFLTLPDGRILHPGEICVAGPDWSDDWMLRFQIVQERKDLVRLRAVPHVRPPEDRVRKLLESMRETLGPEVEFRLEIVDDLELDEAGKFQLIVSKVEE